MIRLRLLCVSSLILLVGFSVSCGSDSKSSSTQSAQAFSNASLKGSYVFTASGSDAADGDYFVAGRFDSDGAGKISAGNADYNLGSGVDTNVPIAGSYTVTPGGSGSLLLNDGVGNGNNIDIALSSSGNKLSNFDSSGGSGLLEQQNTSGFTLAGTYTVTLSGKGSGDVTANATFMAGPTGTITSGTEKITEGGVTRNFATLTGFVSTMLPGGHGIAVIGENKFAYYVISANRIVLAGIDKDILLHGEATK